MSSKMWWKTKVQDGMKKKNALNERNLEVFKLRKKSTTKNRTLEILAHVNKKNNDDIKAHSEREEPVELKKEVSCSAKVVKGFEIAAEALERKLDDTELQLNDFVKDSSEIVPQDLES